MTATLPLDSGWRQNRKSLTPRRPFLEAPGYERLQQPPPFGAGNPHAFEIYGAVLVFFFVTSFPLTRLAAYLERKMV